MHTYPKKEKKNLKLNKIKKKKKTEHGEGQKASTPPSLNHHQAFF